jgi:hypothetical protein
MKKILLLVFVMLLLVTTVNGALRSNLVSYYDFEDTGTTLTDKVVGLNNGTIVNLTANDIVTGKKGNALYFNHTGSFVNITNSTTGHNGFKTLMGTINFWINPKIRSGAFTSKDKIGDSNGDFSLSFSGGKIYTELINSSIPINPQVIIRANDVPTLNNWIMVTYVFGGENTQLYINGTLYNSSENSSILTTNTNHLIIGNNYEGSAQFNGTIDEFGWWNRTLTSDEVTSLWNGGNGLSISEFGSANFSITVTDSWNSSSILDYYAIINGTTFYSNTTTGELTTNINQTGGLVNVSIVTTNYLNKNILNWNTTSNIATTQDYYKSRHIITANISPANTTVINNFSVTTSDGFSGSTVTGSLIAQTTWNTSTIITIIPDSYQTANWTTNGTTNDAHHFNLYTKNSFDLRFFDEVLKTSVNKVTVQLISSIYGINYSTTNGTLYIDLLTPATYTIRYESAGYDQRSYIITLTNMSYNLLNLYLLNSSYAGIVDVTATVYDNSGNTLEGAIINVQKYDGTTNFYQIMNRISTNFEGKAVFSATNNEYYKFLIEYPIGTVVYESTPTYIYSTTMSFVVQVSDDVGSLFTKQAGISYNLSYLGGNLFKFIYTDANNYGSNFCLKIYQESYTGETEINSSCSTSNSATLYGGYVGVNGTTYNAKAYVTIGGKEYLLEKISNANPKVTDFGKTGLFIIAILTIAVMFLSLYNIIIALLLAPIPLFLGAILGIVNISVGLASGVWVGFMIIAIIIGNRT